MTIRYKSLGVMYFDQLIVLKRSTDPQDSQVQTRSDAHRLGSPVTDEAKVAAISGVIASSRKRK